MLRRLEDGVCRLMDRDDSWLGVRRLRPATDRPFTALTLLGVCAVWGIPGAVVAYGLFWSLIRAMAPLMPLRDDSTWFPRMAAWFVFVAFAGTQCVGMWAWNRRAWRLDPEAFSRRRATSDA